MNFMRELLYNMKSISLIDAAAAAAAAMVCGLLISFTYMKTSKRSYTQSFVTTLVMLPIIMGVIIMFVGSNVARAFSMAGTLSIIRFRSAPGEPHDIGYIFFDIAAGLACGVGLWTWGLLFSVALCLFLYILFCTDYGRENKNYRTLKITMPEDLNFSGLFDDIFEKYAGEVSICRIKTTDLGELFEIVYHISMKCGADEKQFIDELRIRNGNLPVTLVTGQL